MSRIRSIHPGLWTDEAFVGLSPFARLFLMGLWNECDDAGSFAWSPLGLKMRILPADPVDASELLSECVGAGIVLRYEVAGKPYGAVRNFCQYQRPKKPNSVHPQSDEVRLWVNLPAREKRDGSEGVPHQSETDGEKPRQMEDGGGNKEDCSGEQSTPAPKRGHGKILIPEDWKPPLVPDLPPKARACAEQWTAASYETEAEAFVCYWRSERKMKADWNGTWANRIIQRHSAIIRDQKFGNAAPATPVNLNRPMTEAELQSAIRFHRDTGNSTKAAELEAELKSRLAA